MCDQTTLPLFTSVISSPGSGGGALPLISPGGAGPKRYGPGRVPASPTALLERVSATRMIAICGQTSFDLFGDSDLSGSLASRLQARLGTAGSILYSQIWKQKVTPAGRLYWAHTASARRTSARDFIGERCVWPTPTARDHKDGSNSDVNVPLNALLGRVAWLTSWATPTATDPRPHDTSGRSEGQKALHGTKHGCACLVRAAQLSNGPARLTTHGDLLTGSSAGMTGGGQLRPAHSLWLMGFPVAWDEAAIFQRMNEVAAALLANSVKKKSGSRSGKSNMPAQAGSKAMAMPSSRKSRRSS